ncbi:er lumen protein retaining receptor-like protein [Trifolium pratense]|uniref:ER lumen protein-retaining receptor n=1 Tax=Trifolium pratense TaxID=57577 RepID=A0A2K3MS40_TRIPR|nr:er lumen protein retaining receptor-like protein [Trifolium pratense]
MHPTFFTSPSGVTRWVKYYLPFLLLLSLVANYIFWAFSIYLEAVAILPQLVLLQRSGNVDNLTGQYVFFLGAYRGFYILNWIYRYLTEPRFTRWIACVSGVLQTALYADFFYYYFIRNFVLQLEEQFKTKVACLNSLEIVLKFRPLIGLHSMVLYSLKCKVADFGYDWNDPSLGAKEKCSKSINCATNGAV